MGPAQPDRPPLMPRTVRSLTVSMAILALGLASVPPAAQAQDAFPPWQVRGELASGLFVSGDQHSALGFDRFALSGRVRGGLAVHPNLVLETAFAAGMFLGQETNPGGLYDLTLGLSFQGGDEGLARLWGSGHAGVGVTGLKVRPVFRLTLGIDIAMTRELLAGPVISYGHVFEDDGPRHTQDAQWLTIGLSLVWRIPPPRPAPPPRREVRRPPPPPIVRDPPPPPPEEEILELVDGAIGIVQQELLVPVLFDHDSFIPMSCSIAALHALREHLAAHGEIRLLEIEGHADGTGSDEYNLDLSRRRARWVRDWLVGQGIEPDRLRAVGAGEGAPIESNEIADGRIQNRRVRFRVLRMQAPPDPGDAE